MFNLFKKKASAPPIRDVVWLSNAAKKKAGLELILKAQNPLLIAWFEESIQDWRTFFESEGASFSIETAPYVQALDVKDRSVFLLEHHPLASRETKVMQHWKPAALTAFVSLEEPLLKLFGGDNLIALVQKMGLAENESLEHSLISRSIRNAQEKLDKKVTHELLVDSVEDWFKVNVEKHSK